MVTGELFEKCWRVVNSAEVGGGVVAVLWHDVGHLCRCTRCPALVIAVLVVSSFCALCLVYLPFVCSRSCSCCHSERHVNNLVCVVVTVVIPTYTHIGQCGLIEK